MHVHVKEKILLLICLWLDLAILYIFPNTQQHLMYKMQTPSQEQGRSMSPAVLQLDQKDVAAMCSLSIAPLMKRL